MGEIFLPSLHSFAGAWASVTRMPAKSFASVCLGALGCLGLLFLVINVDIHHTIQQAWVDRLRVPQPQERIVIFCNQSEQQQQLQQLQQQQQQKQQQLEQPAQRSAPELEPRKPLKPVRVMKILSWTGQDMGHPKDEHWFRHDGLDPFERCYGKYIKDPSIKCTITNDRSKLNESDALIFRGRRLFEQEMPVRPNYNQRWIFYEMEPPYKVYEFSNLTKYKDAFNFTATYSHESDFPHDIEVKRCVINEEKLKYYSKINFAANKTGSATWFATNCKSQSKREAFVKQMQQYMQVDVYGKCGPLECGTNSMNLQMKWSADECNQKLLSDKGSYRFYLAFENSLCVDYLTEKVWKLTPHNIIPVVMGGVDYHNMLPEETHVDVRDFGDAKKLTDFLKKIKNDDALFNRYVARWRSIECVPRYEYMPWECIICKGLHEQRRNRMVVHDIGKFWGSRQCLTPEQYFASSKIKSDFFDVKFR